MLELVRVWRTKANVALTWLEQNEVIANPEKFHALIVRKDRKDTSGQNIDFQGHEIKSEETVKFLGVTLDNKLIFDMYQVFVKKLRHN